MTRKPIIAGNWKMNGTLESLAILQKIAQSATKTPESMLFPPATLIALAVKAAEGSALQIGGQDCHMTQSGAFTGDVSAQMLADCGAKAVIVGHSERRTAHQESNETVCQKAQAAHQAGLTAIICIGESETEYDQGQTLAILTEQLNHSLPDTTNAQNTIIAYEPVWAIGTGKVAAIEEIRQAHQAIRAQIAQHFSAEIATNLRIVYGGSVKPQNAQEIFALEDVDGGLIGGASLKAADFLAIIEAAEKN